MWTGKSPYLGMVVQGTLPAEQHYCDPLSQLYDIYWAVRYIKLFRRFDSKQLYYMTVLIGYIIYIIEK